MTKRGRDMSIHGTSAAIGLTQLRLGLRVFWRGTRECAEVQQNALKASMAEDHLQVCGMVSLTKMKMAFSGSSLILLRIT